MELCCLSMEDSLECDPIEYSHPRWDDLRFDWLAVGGLAHVNG